MKLESAYNCLRRKINFEDILTNELDIDCESFFIIQKDFETALELMKRESHAQI